MSKKNGNPLLSLIEFALVGGMMWYGYNWAANRFNLNIDLDSIISSLSPQPTPSNSPSARVVVSQPALTNPPIPLTLPQSVPAGTVINLTTSPNLGQISQALKQGFEKTFPATQVNINTNEVDTRYVISGKLDLVALERPLEPWEKEQGLVAIPVSQDSLVIVVSNKNKFKRSLTPEQIQGIFTGKITNWSDLGGVDLPIGIINKPQNSDIYKTFQTLVLNNEMPLKNNTSKENLGKYGISYASYSEVLGDASIRILPVAGMTPEAANYPYQKQFYYAYKNPPNAAAQAFLGYATASQGKDIIKQNKLVKTPKPAEIAVKKAPEKPKPTPNLSPWEKKEIRAIYLSRYQVTNRASEETIRKRVRYYKAQGINTIIHGVWGNGCTMYKSEVMENFLGAKSCPNEFREQWLDWLIDEAHRQGMQVHAYFEKGIKIDENSPIFDRAVEKKWIVPGVDRTYSGVEHYVLDVETPEIGKFFTDILVEFVKKYPQIDAVQWDDYLGYHAELPGKVDRTANLTKFVKKMAAAMKQANPKVSFDLCHHNPYWAKRYFAADWENWGVDRVFIQAYNEKNFSEELNYALRYHGIAITDAQLPRLKGLIDNPQIKNILIFPLGGKPEDTAARLKALR
jgi:ABC-type phosphate transport system substrate-binding protein